MTKIHILIFLFTLGCGKTSTEALCEDACVGAEAYFDRCGSVSPEFPTSDGELDATACKTNCVENGEEADARGCSDEFRAILTCIKRTKWGEIACSPDILSSICSVEQSAFHTCRYADDDTGDWDTGW